MRSDVAVAGRSDREVQRGREVVLDARDARDLARRSDEGVGVSRNWGYEHGSDMTGRVVAGWGIVGEVGFAVGRNGN
jgi:hypothetical protein